MVKMRFLNKRPKDSFVAFALEISVSRMLLLKVDQLREKLKKLLQKLSKTNM